MWLLLGTAFVLSGCVGQPETVAGSEDAVVPAQSVAAKIDGEWEEIVPGGETRCSDGTPYRFFARQSTSPHLLVYLRGGGACWFRDNCDPEMQPTYSRDIPESFFPWPFGIFNFDNPDNPFKDHSVVVAPYCTGDVHLGAKDTVYPPVQEGQEDLTILHRGRANVQAVLDWTVARHRAPESVFVTGSSAGAIPSPFYATRLAALYPEARIAQLGDGAGGYRRINGNTRPDQQWGTFRYLNQEPGFADVAAETFNYERLYIAAAKAHPDILFAEYDAAEDAVQKRFLALGGSATPNLLDALRANHADIRGEVDNFRAFIAGGDSHTILGRPEFYTYAADGVSIRDWVADLAAFRSVNDVSCQSCDKVSYAGAEIPAPMRTMWDAWESPAQYVEPFQVFDNLYYVGIDWVAAYVLQTSEGLILIDSLYGSWIRPLEANIRRLGLDPGDIKYVINTHGHFDHAGGSKYFQRVHGAQIVMAEEDWQIAEAKPQLSAFYAPVPRRDIVAQDGDVIELGDTRVELFKTPGHTEGVLTLRYTVRDGDDEHTAITLGGVGLNFSGVARTETYLASYARIAQLQQGVSVSLPNHAAMGRVFERGERLRARGEGEPHPFVDEAGFAQDLATFVANAEVKLAAEKDGTADDPMAELTRAISDDD
ncbi:MAG: pectin acetylesterase-family hydrolase [Pseudomonadota bacterium]